MKKALVSFVIPAFNHERFVRACLDSVMAQTHSEIELIIVNDGSSDQTLEVIRSMERQLRNRCVRVEIVDKPNEGVCKTLNLGLSLARGDFIKVMASDDVATPECVEFLLADLDAHPDCGIVYGDCYELATEDLDSVPPRLERAVRKFDSMQLTGSGDCAELQPEHLFKFMMIGSLVRTEVMRTVGGFDESLDHEDIDYLIRLMSATRAIYLATPVMFHRLHGANISLREDFYHGGMDQIIDKYRHRPILPQQQHDSIMIQLCKASGNYSEVGHRLSKKKLVGWGTGHAYRIAVARNAFSLAYLVDSSPVRQGTVVDGLMVHPPEQLAHEDAEELYVMVFSEFYKQIYPQLERKGLRFKESYY